MLWMTCLLMTSPCREIQFLEAHNFALACSFLGFVNNSNNSCGMNLLRNQSTRNRLSRESNTVISDVPVVVSLKFRELSKTFSRNLCIAEIVLFVRISSWNFVRVPKATLWAHVQSFNLKFSTQKWFPARFVFARLFWRARKTLVKQPLATQGATMGLAKLSRDILALAPEGF